ncbi:MAG: four helix bundle protein [Patescibacteria group bacterium]
MSYRFQNWQVYKDARSLRQEINELTKSFPKTEQFILTNQIRRAVLSVVLQIAEGSNRKTEKDKNLFINRSLTSLDEVVACLDCALDDQYITEAGHKEMLAKVENISKQLRGFEKFISKSYQL